RMIFNPEESIDFHGFTGSFVQYTYARIQSILRKVGGVEQSGISSQQSETHKLLPLERQLIIFLEKYTTTLSEAAEEMNPSVIANYVFNLARLFNSFYVDHSVANAETEEKKILRLRISVMTAHIIKNGLGLLGIKVPKRM
ncbi:MAG TPA: DALR anticodon-binding domain-containing protein, partial [Hanamia sp.]|nr:DALR anticodon-binding domain-containing protein [Hanamia sp.]